MKKLIILAGLFILQGCGVVYYSYYEVDNIDTATWCSHFDGEFNEKRISPTRCVAAYPDSTGHIVYLMETKMKE